MPHRTCPRCGLEQYSAAAWSTQDHCPSCDALLRSQRDWSMGAAFGSALYRRLKSNAAAPQAARRSLEALASSIGVAMLDTGRLLTSELVTNSVEHGPAGSSSIELRASVEDGRLRVEVTDEGDGIDGSRDRAAADALLHWGLVLVENLADRWGASSTSETASVWFELDGASPN